MPYRILALLALIFLLVLPSGRSEAQFPWTATGALPCCQTVPFSTFDPTVDPSTTTLSGGNLTWTCSGCAGVYGMGLGTSNHTVFRWHAEITINPTSAVGCCFFVGLSTAAAVPHGNGLGTNNLSVGYQSGGNVYLNNPTVVATLAAYVDGNTICIEVDASNHLLWLGIAGSGGGGGVLWNNSPTANPTTDTGGINITALTSTVLYPAVSSGFNTAAGVTLNVGASTFACPVSSTYLPWN